MTAMVDIQGLTKRFGPITAVDDISFRTSRGEVLGFLGPNGAGKSTTMKTITGFLAPDAGTVTIDGDDIAEFPVRVKRKLGYLPEGAPLYTDMTPLAFLRFVGHARGMARDELEERVEHVVGQVNLAGVLDQSIETLSRGFKRRVGIAQAILHDPPLLILDEPTDGLDPNQKHEVRDLIRDMASEKAIILSTHILEEVNAVCSRAVIIADGRIVSDATPEELEAMSPHHNAVQLILKDPDRSRVVSVLKSITGVRDVAVSSDNGEIRFEAVPEKNRVIADRIASAVRDNDWKLAAMYVERGRLDEVFREVTGRAPEPGED
ncbi:MAG: putative ABC transporter ATP-binding protein YxlF [Gammaproteobacteria bacterium]|nr:putative ABC transporter ATP-binding protein YxlF [Gammaproteobacteria bacterium]